MILRRYYFHHKVIRVFHTCCDCKEVFTHSVQYHLQPQFNQYIFRKPPWFSIFFRQFISGSKRKCFTPVFNMQCFIFHNSIYMPEASLETRQLEYHFVFTQSKQYKAYSHCLCSMKCHDSAIEVSIYHISSQTWDHLHVHFTLNHFYVSYKCLHPSLTQHSLNKRSTDDDDKIQMMI